MSLGIVKQIRAIYVREFASRRPDLWSGSFTHFRMNRTPEKNPKNSLAPDLSDVLAFRKYTQRVWSEVAGRPISEDEAAQIIEDFGRFLRALASKKG